MIRVTPSGRKEPLTSISCSDCSEERVVTVRSRKRAMSDYCRKCATKHKFYPTVAQGRKKSVYKEGVWDKYKGSNHHAYSGTTHITGTQFNRWHKGAIERDYEWSISIQDIEDVYMAQGGKCVYTDLELTAESAQLNTMSLDRINNSVGYVKGNIQLVVTKINIMKHALDEMEFVTLCQLVAKKRN